jgi:hypothetical protein
VIKKHEAGGGVAVKIEHASYESAKQYGRHCESQSRLALQPRAEADPLSVPQSTKTMS